MALFCLETFKGRTKYKMESNSKLENSFKVKPYPVDLPVQHYGELTTGCDEYLSSVKSDGARLFTLPHGEKVEVTCENIGRLAFLRDGDLSCFILALHTPEDETQVVAVFLQGKWCPVGDVLKTSNKSRRGLVLVESVMERVVLFLLSQVIFGILERPLGEDLYFSAYSLWEHGKILWQNGEAVGFYTVKKKGSLCDGCSGQSYQLPVLDTVFVRSHWRRTGLALQMLEDFCLSQPSEGILGISFPMSPGMYGVCKKYLGIHKEERDRLYEVEPPGEWAQRRNVWLNIQMRDLPKHCGNSEQSPHSSYSHERREADLEEEGILRQCGSSVSLKDTSSSEKKRPADQSNTGICFKKARA
ncbi:LOW QUALITY PROTEIN: protein FAM169B [Rhinichthys klamathensis goyatoka]|uniref:LOW QUALITY PROTEIN: protein FAM169B n=1 Tax=Rhinichthys klamathensis goyatoka TaxID=3034132 RepID=UPI0024B507C5|nr:LOW QUALITY PROTEIN: protein FAM169B [Rhinichthys klamathensis goyatoka]